MCLTLSTFHSLLQFPSFIDLSCLPILIHIFFMSFLFCFLSTFVFSHTSFHCVPKLLIFVIVHSLFPFIYQRSFSLHIFLPRPLLPFLSVLHLAWPQPRFCLSAASFFRSFASCNLFQLIDIKMGGQRFFQQSRGMIILRNAGNRVIHIVK